MGDHTRTYRDEGTTLDHHPLMADEIPTALASEAAQAGDAAAALRYLTRVGAGDLAECLGLAS